MRDSRLTRQHTSISPRKDTPAAAGFTSLAPQAVGKLDIDLSGLAVDLMSFSAHKVYGPKGIGALYVGPRARPVLQAQMHGGGHEGGMRSGTLATHQIVGMGAAFELAGTLRRPHDLFDDLSDGEVSREAGLAGRAEAARHRASSPARPPARVASTVRSAAPASGA